MSLITVIQSRRVIIYDDSVSSCHFITVIQSPPIFITVILSPRVMSFLFSVSLVHVLSFLVVSIWDMQRLL